MAIIFCCCSATPLRYKFLWRIRKYISQVSLLLPQIQLHSSTNSCRRFTYLHLRKHWLNFKEVEKDNSTEKQNLLFLILLFSIFHFGILCPFACHLSVQLVNPSAWNFFFGNTIFVNCLYSHRITRALSIFQCWFFMLLLLLWYGSGGMEYSVPLIIIILIFYGLNVSKEKFRSTEFSKVHYYMNEPEKPEKISTSIESSHLWIFH